MLTVVLKMSSNLEINPVVSMNVKNRVSTRIQALGQGQGI